MNFAKRTSAAPEGKTLKRARNEQDWSLGNGAGVLAAVISIFLGFVVWIVFGQALRHDFVDYDDPDYVVDNPKITNGLSLGGIRWAFTHVHASNWHPLTTMSHMLDCQLYGLQPWGHHLSNIL
jgi:protein O-mannosyl-transferase